MPQSFPTYYPVITFEGSYAYACEKLDIATVYVTLGPPKNIYLNNGGKWIPEFVWDL